MFDHFRLRRKLKVKKKKNSRRFRCNFIWQIMWAQGNSEKDKLKKNRMVLCLASFSFLSMNIVVCNRLVVLYLFIPSKNREFHFMSLDITPWWLLKIAWEVFKFLSPTFNTWYISVAEWKKGADQEIIVFSTLK